MNFVPLQENILPEELRSSALELYHNAFKNNRYDSAQIQQCYTDTEFLEALSDPDYTKIFIVYDNKVISLLLLTNNLTKAEVTYVNSAFLTHKYPGPAERKNIFYITFIGTRTQYQKTNAGVTIFQEALKHIDATEDNEAVLAFDFCSSKEKWFLDAILRIIDRMKASGDLKFFNPQYNRSGYQEFGALCSTNS